MGQSFKRIKNNKNSSMKAIHLLIATLIMMSLASCTAESSDPVDNSSSTYFWKERMAPEVLHTRKTILTI